MSYETASQSPIVGHRKDELMEIAAELTGEGLQTSRMPGHSVLARLGKRVLTISEWRELLESDGFEIESVTTAPMHLLEPMRLLRDEGVLGALRFAFRVLRDRDARRRVLGMRRA